MPRTALASSWPNPAAIMIDTRWRLARLGACGLRPVLALPMLHLSALPDRTRPQEGRSPIQDAPCTAAHATVVIGLCQQQSSEVRPEAWTETVLRHTRSLLIPSPLSTKKSL